MASYLLSGLRPGPLLIILSGSLYSATPRLKRQVLFIYNVLVV